MLTVILTGPQGCGKTTTATILRMLLAFMRTVEDYEIIDVYGNETVDEARQRQLKEDARRIAARKANV